MKHAILVVSFGTTHLDTLERTIQAVERELASAFPEMEIYRAFTSGIVRRRLESKYDLHVDSVEQALCRMRQDGVTHAVVQPTLLLPGEEFDRLRSSVLQNAGGMQCAIGLPLLWDDRDLDFLAACVRQSYPVPEDTLLLAMGHGTSHEANALYPRLAEKLPLCTVEGKPDFADALAGLLAQEKRKVHLVPLLLVAGDHSKNDMAGETDSLRALLEQFGFSVSWTLAGLGELPAVRERYVRRVRAALDAE